MATPSSFSVGFSVPVFWVDGDVESGVFAVTLMALVLLMALALGWSFLRTGEPGKPWIGAIIGTLKSF
jgi:hypothetical protein